MQLYQVRKLKTTHAIVLIFESFEIQTLAGNTAMLFLRKVQKSRKAFLKGYPKHVNLDEKMGHFLRSCLSLFKKGYLKMKKRFSQKKSFSTFLNPRM